VKKLDSLFRLYLNTYKPEGKVYIFLDEVQTIAQWEKFVTSYVNTIVKYFKSTGKRVNFDTVSDYTSYLLQSMVLHSSERYHIKTRQILKGERKLYLNDMSFRNFLYGERYFNPAACLENYVFLKLLNKGYQVFTGAFRDGEIDFIALKANERIYFQVSYS